MRIDDGTIVLETRPCYGCDGSGTIASRTKCVACYGSGNGPRGGRGGCRKCHGSGIGHDHDNRATCISCDGIGQRPEDLCDRVNDEDMQAFTLSVYRSDRAQSWNEAHMGHGCVYSCTDYGEHARMTDDELIARVRRSLKGVQATKIANRAMQVCDHIGIFCNDNGYSVRAVFESAAEVERDAASELTVAEGSLFGQMIFAEGGNGTMAAATTRVPR